MNTTVLFCFISTYQSIDSTLWANFVWTAIFAVNGCFLLTNSILICMKVQICLKMIWSNTLNQSKWLQQSYFAWVKKKRSLNFKFCSFLRICTIKSLRLGGFKTVSTQFYWYHILWNGQEQLFRRWPLYIVT